jgi:hypothetical protein
MERSGGSAATLTADAITPAKGRGASLSIRLSAVIVTATVDEPRVLTVRIGHEPIEALPSGPLEVEHRTLEVGLRAWDESPRTRGAAGWSGRSGLAELVSLFSMGGLAFR